MQVLAKQQEPLCLDCFQFSLGRTVRHTIRTKCLIEAGDSVLVALSGGSSSLALLLLLQEICDSKQQAARHGQVGSALLASLIHLTSHCRLTSCMGATQQLRCDVGTQETFRLGAIHVDETVAYNESEALAQQRTKAVRSTVAGIDESMPFHSVLLEDALPSDGDSVEEPATVQRHYQLQDLVMASLSCL